MRGVHTSRSFATPTTPASFCFRLEFSSAPFRCGQRRSRSELFLTVTLKLARSGSRAHCAPTADPIRVHCRIPPRSASTQTFELEGPVSRPWLNSAMTAVNVAPANFGFVLPGDISWQRRRPSVCTTSSGMSGPPLPRLSRHSGVAGSYPTRPSLSMIRHGTAHRRLGPGGSIRAH